MTTVTMTEARVAGQSGLVADVPDPEVPPPLPSWWPRAAGFVVAGPGMTDCPCC